MGFLTRYKRYLPLLALFFPALPAPGLAPAELEGKIREAARRSQLDHRLVTAVIQVESAFKADAVSRAGAMGLMQVIPSTASEIGIRNPYHEMNIPMGATGYLRRMINRYRGDIRLALAAYNAGPGNVDRYKGIPPFKETRKYVKRVMKIYRKLKKRRVSRK